MIVNRASLPLEEILEKDWQKQVIQLALQLGWKRAYHTFDSRRSQTGFPDLVLVRDRIIFLELKRETSHLVFVQQEWLKALLAAEGECYVARPRHLEALAHVLTRRRRPEADDPAISELLADLRLELERPAR